MRVYYDRDADINLIKGKKVAIIGYGSQGHAHALNLRDSGVKDVAVALRKDSQGVKKAEGEKLKVMEVAAAAKWADVMMMLTPDELQADIYREHLVDNMKKGAALMFAHGLNVHFNLIEPRADLDVMMIAPKGPGSYRARRVSARRRRSRLDGGAQGRVGQCPRSHALVRGRHRRRTGRHHRDHVPRGVRDRPVRRAVCALRRPRRTDEGGLRDPGGRRAIRPRWPISSACTRSS